MGGDKAEYLYGRTMVEANLQMDDSVINDCEMIESDVTYGDKAVLLKVKVLKRILSPRLQ